MIPFIWTNAVQRVKRAVKHHTTAYTNPTLEPCKLSTVNFFGPKTKNAELTNGSSYAKSFDIKNMLGASNISSLSLI